MAAFGTFFFSSLTEFNMLLLVHYYDAASQNQVYIQEEATSQAFSKQTNPPRQCRPLLYRQSYPHG